MKLEIRVGITGAGGEVLSIKSTESNSADETEQCDTALADLAVDFESMVGALHAMFDSATAKYRPRWEKWKVEYDKAEAEKAAKLEAIKAKKEKADALAKKEAEAAEAEAAAKAAAAKALPQWNGLPDPVPNWPAKVEEASAVAPEIQTP